MNPLPPALQWIDRTHVLWGDRAFTYFSGCDYLRMAADSRVLRAMRTAIGRPGNCNVSASRLTTGNHPLYLELESKLASFFGFASATLVSSGYAANLVAAQALSGQCARVSIDAKAHSSLRLAATLLGVPSAPFAHRDISDLRRQSRGANREGRTLVLTDGLFSFSGAVPDLKGYAECLGEGDILLVDDAHGAGLLGARGRGVLESKPRLSAERLILTIALSKSFGSYGGVVLASRALQKQILEHSHLFAGSTPPPLPMVAGALAAMKILESRGQLLRQQLAANIAKVRVILQNEGLDVPNNPGPIIGLVPKSKDASARVRSSLVASSIYPPLVVYPGAPTGGYYRFAFSSAHTANQLDRLAKVLRRHVSDLDPI